MNCSARIIAALVCIFLSISSSANQRRSAQVGIIKVSGATVYRAPSFDAPVMKYLELGKKVLISTKIHKGIGGFGAFYKVKLDKNQYGYIADVEVAPKLKKSAAKHGGYFENPEFETTKDAAVGREPIYFTRYLGVSLGGMNYSEKLTGKSRSSQTLSYGLRMSGPGTLFDGPPLDFSLLLHIGVPDFYDEVVTSATGFFLLSDALLMMPFIETQRGLIYYGLGLMAVYTNFQLTINRISTNSVDSQELRMGAALSLGYAHRLGSQLLRADFKYYYEKEAYPAYFLTWQTEY